MGGCGLATGRGDEVRICWWKSGLNGRCGLVHNVGEMA